MESEHIQKMRDAALVASTVIAQTAAEVKPGITLNELDIFAAELVEKLGALPFNLGYKPSWATTAYPAVLCTSVNNEIAHGIPNDYALKEGDTICLDIGIKFNGLCGDCAMTVPVGEVDNQTRRLLRHANRACYAGIEQVTEGAKVINIGKAIDNYTRDVNYVTNKTLSGHSIGEQMHEGITVPHFYESETKYMLHFSKMILKAGDVICIEPMLTTRDRKGKLMHNGWTLRTSDGRRSAMFEHMVLVKEDGHEILTDHFIKA